MPALDPSGYQISVAVNTADGIRVPLWMKGSGGGAGLGGGISGVIGSALSSFGGALPSGSSGVDLTSMDLPIVESVEFELGLGLMGKVTINIAAPYDLGLTLLESNLFKITNVYELQIGYPRLNRYTPWISAVSVKPSIRISSDEGLSATLNGEVGGIAATRGVSGRVFKGKTYKEIIKSVADDHDWEVSFSVDGGDLLSQAVAAVDPPIGGLSAKDALEKKRDDVSQGQSPDWFFVQKLARSAQCDAFLGPSLKREGRFTLYVRKRKEVFGKDPFLKFTMRGRPDFEKVFPVFSFESDPQAVWLPGSGISAKTQGIDPDTGNVKSSTASSDTSSQAALGSAGVPDDKAKRKIGSATVKVSNSQGRQRSGDYVVVSQRDPRGPQDVAQSHHDEAALRGGINGSITTFGIPEMMPGNLIQTDGLGIYNSLYLVLSMKHSANDTEWTMTIECLNNASAAGMMDDVFLKDPQKSNDSSVKDDPVGSSGSAASTVIDAVKEGV